MAKEYFKKRHWVNGYKGLTKSGKKTYWILLGVLYGIIIFVGIYFFPNTIRKSYNLLLQINYQYGFSSVLKVIFTILILLIIILLPILIIKIIEPSLPHISYEKTYYTEEYFCAGCGNYLGKSEPYGACSNCGSNRYTTDDPGAGNAIRQK